jgi:hypothetical protein
VGVFVHSSYWSSQEDEDNSGNNGSNPIEDDPRYNHLNVDDIHGNQEESESGEETCLMNEKETKL